MCCKPVSNANAGTSYCSPLINFLGSIVKIIQCLAVPLIIVGSLGAAGTIMMPMQAYWSLLGIGLSGALLWCCGNANQKKNVMSPRKSS